MALTSTLFTGLSGLNVNQTRLNVVGNNIANVNTVAFKSSRALFKPQFYITDSGGSGPSNEFGGANPSQRGLGAVVSAIEKDFSPGSIEPTGKGTDLAIDGDGFFIVRGSEQRFTRDGSFVLNETNQLVTSNGDFVQGFGVDDDGNIIPGQLGRIVIPLGTDTSAKATENVKFEGNLNADGTTAAGQSILLSEALTTTDGSAITDATPLTLLSGNGTTANFTAGQTITLSGKRGGRDLPDFTFTVGAPGSSTVGDLQSFLQRGLGIDTSVGGTPPPGVHLEADTTDPTRMRLVITGNTGSENALSLAGSAFTNNTGGSPLAFADGTDAAGNVSDPTGESVHTSFVAYDSLGTPITVDVTAVLESKSDTGNVWRFYATSGDDTTGDPAQRSLAVGTGTITFDSEGKLMGSTNSTIIVNRAATGAKTPLALKLDFSSMTSLTSSNSELVMTKQDGTPIGTLNAFTIGADGSIVGSYDNGLTRTLGQVAVATFANPQGLVDKGGNVYVTGTNSGLPVITSPLSLGAGSIRSGALELSNVDLSEEFINLIISSTGFSAASRVITTSDELLTELLNTSR